MIHEPVYELNPDTKPDNGELAIICEKEQESPQQVVTEIDELTLDAKPDTEKVVATTCENEQKSPQQVVTETDEFNQLKPDNGEFTCEKEQESPQQVVTETDEINKPKPDTEELEKTCEKEQESPQQVVTETGELLQLDYEFNENTEVVATTCEKEQESPQKAVTETDELNQAKTDTEELEIPCEKEQESPEQVVTETDELNQAKTDTEKKQGSSEQVVIQDKTDSTFGMYKQIVKHLGLQKYFPRKLTREVLFLVSKNVNLPDELNDDPSKIPWYMLQNLIMCNYEGRCFDLEESQSSHENAYSLSSALEESEESINHSTENSKVSPIDALVVTFLCCDNFLRQIVIEKLSICQLAIPLLIPVTDVEDKEWEMIVWGMSTITKKWQTISGLSCERSMVVERLPIVSALRLGKPKISKSKVANYVIIGQNHDIFFHYGCKGGNLVRKLSDGLLEMAWYLPIQERTDAFADALTFINLRGNASDFQKQAQFLSEISLVSIVFVAADDFKEYDTKLLESFYMQNGHVIFILDKRALKDLGKALHTMETSIKNVKKQVQYIISTGKNELTISKDIWKSLGRNFKGDHRDVVSDRSIEECIELAHTVNYHVDEMESDCSEAKQSAKELLEFVKLKGKANELPLQKITLKIAETKREQHRLERKGNMQIQEYVDKLQKEMACLRQQQLEINKQRLNVCAYQIFRTSFSNTLIKRKYFFGFVKIMTDQYSIDKLQPIRDEYICKWNELCDQKKAPETTNEQLETLKYQLDELEQQLSSASVGLEHFNREIGQNYEFLPDFKSPKLDFDNFHLAEVAAEMLLHGYPIELMDGDAVHVPIAWIRAVLKSLAYQIGNKKMFVLSVLGIQSSGKSTLLNAMFGLQFSVSAGRCTKGIFAQLVSLDTGLGEDTKCDYILVVDTEGLRSSESGIQHTNNRDNELATFVIGMGDLTIINIMGENSTDIQDTLQIAVHAFMKMENVHHIKPSCLFVHQNVNDVTASDLNTVQKRSMREILDNITQIAAEAENCGEKYKSFSDVIHFQENKHIMYISGLWQGDPPMAPPNPGYSKCILQVKKQVLEIMKNSEPKHIDEFTILLSDLWKAILGQDFVFSFKNSLEIQAFNALNVEYVKHARTFRRNALEYSYGLQNECKKLTAEKVKEEQILDDYLMKLEKDILTFQSSMASYFEKEKKACQWKCKMELQLDDLCNEIKRDLRDVYTSIKNRIIGRAEIDATIKMHEQTIYQKAKKLTEVYRKRQFSEEVLEREFAKNWNEWVSVIPRVDDYVNIHKSFERITEGYYTENDKFTVTSVLLSDCSKCTEVLEKDLTFLSKPGSRSNVTYVNQANSTKQDILEKLQTKILNHAQNGRSYTKQLGFQLFSSLSSELGEINMDEKVCIHKKSNIRLAVSNFKVTLIPSLEKMQEQYKQESDPRLYMESQKEKLWQMFKEECKDLNILVKVVSAISREFASAIKTSLPEKCKLGVIDNLRYTSGKGFSSKMSLHAWMLVEMAEKGDFKSFVQYLSNPIQSIKTFTSEQIEKMCFQEKDNSGSSVHREIYNCKVREILARLKQAIINVNASGMIYCDSMTMKLWWSILLEYIDKELCVKTDMMFFDEETELDVKELSDKLILELDNVQETIINAYDSRLFSDISTSFCDFFTADLLACQNVCPFCNALCELHGPHDHHRTECHMPQGIAGYKHTFSGKLVTDVCTTSVLCNYPFLNEHTNLKFIKFRDYRTVNDYYASWKIEPLPGEAETFWKWFMATYNTELAEYYHANKADIPDGWNSITMEDAKRDMRKWYDI
ncbi:interferon-induced very large GTPase 1-like [Antedon mediterranea]|uniref:interferon-induced very large GTPase 1-like n=1 Tax=Antedon mediterranea TaxID=105859 RepID=UPI003AF9576A